MSAYSTIGVTVNFATIGPNEGLPVPPVAMEFANLSNEITSIPAFDNAPSGIDVTPLSELVTIRRIPGLKDNGEDFALTGNFNDQIIQLWNGFVQAYENAKTNGQTWYLYLQIIVPGISKKYYIAGFPIAVGLPSIDVNSAFQGELHLVPYKDWGWIADPESL